MSQSGEPEDSLPQSSEWPEPKYNIFSIVSFWWLNPLLYLGYKQPLKHHDLYQLPVDRRTGNNFTAFKQYWIPRVTPSITWPLIKTYKYGILFSVLCRFLFSICMFIPPIALDNLLSWVVVRDPYYMGYVYGAIMFFAGFIGSVVSGQYEYRLWILSMEMRSVVNEAIYQKSLRLSPDSKKKYTTGQITNLMSVDSNKLHNLILFMNVAWSAVFQLAIAVYLLWQQLGVASLAGLGFMILSLPATICITQRMRKGDANMMAKKDERSKLMNQILSGIKVIKLYCWENALKEQVNSVRVKEMKQLRKLTVFYSIMFITQDTMPILVAVISLTTFALIDVSNTLTAAKAFVSLTLFNLIRTPLHQLPFIIQSLTMYAVSSGRINAFLNSEESDLSMVSKREDSINAVTIESGSFKWSNEESSPNILKGIDLKFPSQKLVAIVGRVGSGKSSILSALLGEMYKVTGSVNVSGSLAYVPQVAWIQNRTLKENILFTKKLSNYKTGIEEVDEAKYQAVIKATALEADISILQAGDETEIGEKGINLSGGQKQRVSLARAVYYDSDIYLLDDPLSAVDSHVGQHIFDQVIGPNGLLATKTRILVTHRISVLPFVDQIIVMKDGSVSEIGTYQELMDLKGDFSVLMNEYSTEEKGSGDKIEVDDGDKQVAELEEKGDTMSNDAKKGKLTETEKDESGSVSMAVYLEYLKSAGVWLCLLVLALTTTASFFNIASSLWLSKWAEDGELNRTSTTEDNDLRNLRIQVYSGLSLLEAFIQFLADLVLFYAAVTAASKLHDRMLARVLRAPMSFFDTTPLGRILNRFTKDVDGLDVYAAFYIRFALYSSYKVLITVIVISIQSPYFLIIVLPLSIIYYVVRMFFISTSRQLTRIESSTKSPIYSHFTETIAGSSCIKAFGVDSQFIKEFEDRNDFNLVPWLLSQCVTRWNAFRLELIGHVVVFSCVLLATLLGETNAATVGLSITYALSVTAYLNLLIRYSADLESNIVAAERIIEYSNIETEASEKIDGSGLTAEWPKNASVKFENFSTRYRLGLDLILKDVSFEVNPNEKVGIVGRTGAGKSSLTLALFRLIEPVSGKIIIDDIDISKIGLADLRSRITIIPQDPVLFTSSLRMNLDPFSQHSDDVIWSVLEMADLKTFVKGLESGLNHKISEGGENLSVGQRQLICLSRALLRKTKLLILDEATAAVDVETDSLIQKTIQEQFSNCTILTIAHRLNTVLEYDRILVLDNGQVAEYDTPANLLSDPSSMFHSLAKKAGLVQNNE